MVVLGDDRQATATELINLTSNMFTRFNMSLGINGNRLVIIDHELNKTYKVVTEGEKSD